MKLRNPYFWIVLLVFSVMLAWSAPVLADAGVKPDMVITKIVFDPASPVEGTQLKAQVWVTNQGPGQALFQTNDRVLASTPFNQGARATTDNLFRPGESKIFTVVLTAAGDNSYHGTHLVQFTVDPDNKVQEANEGNNTLAQYVTFGAPGQPAPVRKLQIVSLQVSPTKADPSTNLYFTVQVKNIGTAATTLTGMTYAINSGRYYSLNHDTPLPVSLVPGQVFLYQGHTKPNSLLPLLPAGLQIFTVKPWMNADQGDQRQVQVEIVDPAIGSVRLPTLSINNINGITENRDAARIEFRLVNEGDEAALFPAGAVRYNIRENNQVVATNAPKFDYVYNIGASRQEFEIIRNLSPGNHTFEVTLDPNNVVKEKDETRHRATVTVNIFGPDLAITRVKALPENPDTRSSIDLDVTVKNLGPVKWAFKGGEPFLYYGVKGYSRKHLPAPSNVELASGQEYTARVTLAPFTSKAGSYDVLVNLQQPGDPQTANNEFILPINIKLLRLEKVDPSDINKPAGADHPHVLDNKPPVGAGPKLPTGR